MDKKTWILSGIAVVATIVAVLFGGMLLQKNLGTGFTSNPGTNSFTDSGADWRQNLQAVSERMATGSQYAVLQAGSNGVMERVAPSSLTLSGLSLTGDTKVANSVLKTGDITAKTASTTQASVNTFTAANVCDSALITLTEGNSSTIIWTLPSTTTLFADCLTATGSISVVFYNTETVTTTVLAAGSGGTLDYVSTSTLGPLKQTIATFIKNGATYLVHIDI